MTWGKFLKALAAGYANGHAEKIERLVNEVVGTYGGAR